MGLSPPRSGGRDIFFHISKWNERRDPAEGDHVSYVPALDQRSGRLNATDVKLERP
jgi:cold shock CspA family protein